MMFKPTLRALCGVMAALLAGMAFAASAQFVQPQPKPPKADPNATPPAGLKWKWMNEIVFNSTNFASTGTSEERELLSKIWARELSGTLINSIDGSLLPSFSLIGLVEYRGEKVVLTMYDRAGYLCVPPGNGVGVVDTYSSCPLRLVRLLPNGQRTEQNLKNDFCMRFGDNPQLPRSKNHIEYGFDERTGIVYLRDIQRGQVVPECNRALRVFAVE